MTTFQDGPAAGVILGLQRAPKYLRVVRQKFADDPKWDALDQLTDRPEPNEEVFAYRLVEYRGHVHVCRRPTGSGYFAMATYAHIEQQPPVDVLRNTAKWQRWAQEQHQAEQANAKGG